MKERLTPSRRLSEEGDDDYDDIAKYVKESDTQLEIEDFS